MSVAVLQEPEAAELVYYRLRTTEHEIIVAPCETCTLVVLQGKKGVVAEEAAAAPAAAAEGAEAKK